MTAARRHRSMRPDELPSWVLARRLGLDGRQAVAELARRYERAGERLGDSDERTVAEFVEWLSGLDSHPPGRPRGSADRHPDAAMRRSQAQRRRRRAEVTAAA